MDKLLRVMSRRVRTPPLVIICIIIAAVIQLPVSATAGYAQIAETLSQVKRVYVGSLGDKQGATELHDKLIRRLRKARGIEVVAGPSEADAIITGTGEIWVKGYVSTGPRPSPYGRQPVYDGYLSVELRGKDNVALWSYSATPGMFLWSDLPQDLVNRFVKQLLAALDPNRSVRR
jgi:hypothetical protein